MFAIPASLERDVFRAVNSLVEPAVRRGVASSRLLPLSLIVVESTGYRSGRARSTPLWSWGIGPYRVVGTLRGARSFWVKNLRRQPELRYFVGGRPRDARAILMGPDCADRLTSTSPLLLRALATSLDRVRPGGWAFAILVPARDAGIA